MRCSSSFLMKIKRIISGGQTGADRGGLEGARDAGVETGGCAPLGYRTDTGDDFSLRDFGLTESTSRDYPPRTKSNVMSSDGTVIFGRASPGSVLTERLCGEKSKPYIWFDAQNMADQARCASDLREWCETKSIAVLNVAGNRERNFRGITEKVRAIVSACLREVVADDDPES